MTLFLRRKQAASSHDTFNAQRLTRLPEDRISSLTLRVSNPDRLAAFYCDVLGMQLVDGYGGQAVSYTGQGAALILSPCDGPETYQHDPSDRYWKIAITLPDLDIAYAQLQARGIEVTQPNQFRDIAYMSHMTDPEGHVIELIQHNFLGNPLTKQGDRTLSLGGGANIGLITLRTSDIETDLSFCRDELGMRYLSRQDVPDLNFCLYFLGFSQEATPVPNVDAVENREWLWQRPYTVLEFQYRKDDVIRHRPENSIGAASVQIEAGNNAFRSIR
ncbi:glyoxalase I [Roseibium album]|nr:glyoxalase I [Roseibium album]